MADQWTTVEISLDPILDPINPVIENIDSVLEFLIVILNITQTILNVIKAFMVGLLDPLRAIVELIIEEVQGLIADLRQLGIYLTGDWALIDATNKHSNLLGGYQAYERRMIARLLDTSDPNRPDFSSSSSVLGVFLYTSSGDITEIIRLIRALMSFFGQGGLMAGNLPYGTPTTPMMKYGTEGAGVGAFKNLASAAQSAIPDRVSVSWAMPSGAGGIGSAFSPAPKGFLIHVSTIPDGLNTISLTPNSKGSAEIENLPIVSSAGVDPLTSGVLKLYGGVADIKTDADDFEDVDPLAGNSPHKATLVLQKDVNTPLIRMETLVPSSGVIPLLANTYFVKTGFLTKLGPGTNFTAVFDRDDLPLAVDFEAGSEGYAEIVSGSERVPDNYYIRVRAVDDDYVEGLGITSAPLSSPVSLFPYNYKPYTVFRDTLINAVNGKFTSETDAFTGWQHMTPASGAGVAEFPTAPQVEYIQGVMAAMAVAILVRADLTESALMPEGGDIFNDNTYANGQATGLEGAARDLMAWYGISPSWFRGRNPIQFRNKLKRALLRMASDLQSRASPPESVANALSAYTGLLLNFTWNELDSSYPELTILESLGISSSIPTAAYDPSKGVGGNPLCRSHPPPLLEKVYRRKGGPERTPYYVVDPGQSNSDAGEWMMNMGSGDMSPIIYSDARTELSDGGRVITWGENKAEFIRAALMDESAGQAVLIYAASILQLAAASVSRPTGDTKWIALRLMPNSLPEADRLLENLDRFLQGVLDGLEGIIDKIVAYIEAIQARIYQLQALLQMIRALLRSIEMVQLPSASGLVLVESGTAGLVQGLVTAENKPSDLATSYGGGLLFVAGGLPTVLLEILQALLGGGE